MGINSPKIVKTLNDATVRQKIVMKSSWKLIEINFGDIKINTALKIKKKVCF